jgi:light-regulated signal transduction histidine kinase (bacteriophytochrome)
MPSQDSDTVVETHSPVAASQGASDELQIQPSGFLIVMSLDWIVLRASENVDDFLDESHVTLIEEPLSRFVQAQALHDLRNHFSRLSGSTGIARAYRIRLTDDRPRLDIAFQVSDGRVLLEAAPSPQLGLGEAIGAVGGLIDGLAGQGGASLLEGAARRMRALTGFDRCSMTCGEQSAESSRGDASAPSSAIPDLPPIVADTAAAPVSVFPRRPKDGSTARALLRSPPADSLEQLRERGIGATMTVPLTSDGQPSGVIRCESRSAREPNFELHAAAELFAQMFALRLEVDRLRSA